MSDRGASTWKLTSLLSIASLNLTRTFYQNYTQSHILHTVQDNVDFDGEFLHLKAYNGGFLHLKAFNGEFLHLKAYNGEFLHFRL